MNNLIIIGAGGHGKVAADIAIILERWKNVYFLDDTEVESSLGIKVIGTLSDAIKYKNKADFFVAFGDNYLRRDTQRSMQKEGYLFTNLVHPDAVIGQGVILGKGNVVMAGVVINPLTRIGDGCIVNTGSTLDHDNRLDDFVHVGPGVNLAGSVYLGEACSLGTGAIVINNIKITEGCVVGAGTLVINNIKKNGTYVGVPAVKIK